MSHPTQAPPLPVPQATKSKGRGVLVFIGVFLIAVCLLVLAAMTFDFGASNRQKVLSGVVYQESVVEEGEGISKILILDIDGVISSDGGPEDSMIAVVRSQLREVRSNPEFSGVLLRVNSPGGGVTASDQIYEEVMKTKAAGKKVLVFMDEIAASGGYYIACGADHIIATPTTITGSIGVIISSINATELLGKIGVKPQVFTSGDFKDTLSLSREMRPDEKVYIQAMVEASYQRFISLVSAGRDIDIPTLKERNLIDGRIFSGVAAKEAGLVDQVGYWDDAVAKIRSMVGDEQAPLVRVVPEVDLFDVVSMFGVKAQGSTEVKLDLAPAFGVDLRPAIPYALPVEYVR